MSLRRAFRNHHQGEQVNLTARLATIFRTSGGGQSNATRAAVTPSAFHPAKGTCVRSITLARTRLAVAITATLTALLLAFCAQALATTGHTFAGSFGGPGAEDGQFINFPTPPGVGVGLGGEVFVVDTSRIQRFDAGGAFQSVAGNGFAFGLGGIAVDSAPAGGVYSSGYTDATGPEVVKYSAAGLPEYTLDTSLSETSISSNFGSTLAVDPANGTVYAAAMNINTGAPVIDSFSQSTGAFIASFNGESGSPDGGFACPSGLAVDPTQHVYVLDPCKGVGRVDEYSSAGAYEATVDDGSRGAPQAVATDPKTGEVYVAEAGASGLQITNFAAEGTSVIYTIPASNVGALSSLAVGPDGTVYAFDSANSVVDRFTAFIGPTVTTAAAGEVERTSATLKGTIDPGGIASEYHYEYGLDNTYGSSTESIDAGSGSGAIEAPGPVTGLVPNTTYHYRIVGSNASGAIVGEDQTLTTEAAPPTLDGSPAFVTTITPTGARVHATVNPQHSLTSFRIEYGTSTAYGANAPEPNAEVGEQSSDQPVATTLTGLQPDTLYHFRLSAENGVEGPQTGADGTFITAPAAAASASELTTAKATLTGTINPHGSATTYHFNYGPGASYGASTPELSGGSANGDQTVSEHISGLSPGRTYHVQVVATSNGISRSGADGTFTTAPAPGASASDPVAVTTSSAMLQGAADTHGQVGSYHFEVTATEGSFTTSTAEQPLPAAMGSQSLSVPVSGLPSGQSLRVRLVVSSNEASEVSEPVVFATASPPPQGFPAPPSPGSLYGCTAPKLNPLNATVKPGSTITISGSDLGLAGSVLLGEDSLIPTNWSASAFTIEVPADASGTLGLTVNCGVASNTIAVATNNAPALNTVAFAITKRSVKGSSATLTVSLPGPGRLQASGPLIKSAASNIAKAGVQAIQVKLSKAGAKALAKAKKRTLAVKLRLTFTPTGGAASSQSATVTFKRKGAQR